MIKGQLLYECLCTVEPLDCVMFVVLDLKKIPFHVLCLIQQNWLFFRKFEMVLVPLYCEATVHVVVAGKS